MASLNISHYRIIKKLGAGGMGEVYLAEDTRLGRRVAVKLLTPESAADERARKRLIKEAQAAAILDHPNVCTIHEIGEEGDRSFIVMQYVEGETLASRMQRGPLPLWQSLDIATQIADALSEAHSRSIIHRDIKPHNIMLTPVGKVKVLDFGIAKSFKGVKPDQVEGLRTGDLTESGAIMGTLSYMSPEQLQNKQLDERTDIFSFGIVLYEMIAGSHPFPGTNSIEVAASILSEKPFQVSRLSLSLPAGLTSLLRSLLEKDREKRCSSFVEVKRALQALRKRLPPALLTKTTKELAPPSGAGEGIAQKATLAFRSREPAPPTILVLPLEAVGPEHENSFIGIGLAHAIMTDLARISSLSVLSKAASAGRIDKAGRGARDLAAELGATILLEGEVLRAERTVAIMVRLTDAETGRVIWGEQYRGDMSDIFSIQDDVCEGVAAALQINIGAGRHRTVRYSTANIEALELYSQGRAFLERRDVRGNVDSAIAMFKKALELDPGFALPQAGLGEAYWLKYQATREAGWVEQAIAASDRALVLDPYHAQVHISLAIIYHGTGKVERAIAELERAIELQPLSDDAYRWLGRCHMRKGDMEQAVRCFNKAIEIRPRYWENYNVLGLCYVTFGRFQDALEQWRRVIDIQPDNDRGYANLGSAYYHLGHYEDAVSMYRRAIDINPNPLSYSNLGTAYFYLGQYEEAVTSFQTAIELTPRDDLLHHNLGDAYLRLGRSDDAESEFKLAIKLLNESLSVNPGDVELLGRLATCQAKLGLEEEALMSINRAIALEPHNTTVMYQMAVAYALTGKIEEAIEFLSQALAHGYSRSEAERDPDLQALHTHPKYISIFATGAQADGPE